ncbi:MAG: HAMP domain-containing histidine kinase [Planctomycetes bacterium]|nr:HAMP domain-containing histidine kinase [Planctomycetota bacterium]MBI3847328.1 HAMP domain-containing histidine kinase [Planctomycetota bacterium]
MSHEILNPVNTISLACQYLETLLARQGTLPGETVREHLRIIHLELGRIRKVLDDCSRFRRAPVERLESVDLGAIVRVAVEAFGRSVERPDVRLDVAGVAAADGLRIDLAPAAFREALTHLMQNAQLAMPSGGTIRVEIRRVGKHVVLEVADDGVGIDANQRRVVFEPYFTTRANALGIGLTLVRAIVHAHGGNVTLRSRPGKGTRVAIRLPIGALAPAGRGGI